MEEHNFLGILGEIQYYGGTAEEWLIFLQNNPGDSLEDYRDALKFAHQAEQTKEKEGRK